jgi:hypothetical protein
MGTRTIRPLESSYALLTAEAQLDPDALADEMVRAGLTIVERCA